MFLQKFTLGRDLQKWPNHCLSRKSEFNAINIVHGRLTYHYRKVQSILLTSINLVSEKSYIHILMYTDNEIVVWPFG